MLIQRKRSVLNFHWTPLPYCSCGYPPAAFLSLCFPNFICLLSLLFLNIILYDSISLLLVCTNFKYKFCVGSSLFSLVSHSFPPSTVMIFSLRVSLLRNLRRWYCEKVAVIVIEKQQEEEDTEEQVHEFMRERRYCWGWLMWWSSNPLFIDFFCFLHFLSFSFSVFGFWEKGVAGFFVLGFSPFSLCWLVLFGVLCFMSQPRQFQMVGGTNAGQFNDTTYTKIFVGGLAWETQRDTMRRYFEQFGEIQEAVVITDKNTGRSKGYGFVSPFLQPFFFSLSPSLSSSLSPFLPFSLW